jgi:GTPase SAR1 family protein
MSDSEEEGTERQLKLVLLGEPQVGKTAIAQR